MIHALPMRRNAPARSGARRTGLLQVRITTEPCPHVMLRVLDVLARHSIIPWGFIYTRKPRCFRIEIEVDDLPPIVAEKLAAPIMVRSVRVSGRRRSVKGPR